MRDLRVFHPTPVIPAQAKRAGYWAKGDVLNLALKFR